MWREPLPPQLIDDVTMVILKPEENDGTLLRDIIATPNASHAGSGAARAALQWRPYNAPAGGAGSADFIVPTAGFGPYTRFRVLFSTMTVYCHVEGPLQAGEMELGIVYHCPTCDRNSPPAA
jgi:hypothetical protein